MLRHSFATCLTALAAWSCGDNVDSATCAPGTIESEGECVPDGTVICEQGTILEPSTGSCVLDPSACGAGTVLIDGRCVLDDGTIAVDLEEAAEPNDPGEAGRFEVPPLDAAVTIHGCITPVGDAPDLDRWIITTTEPAVLELTVDGVGGLAGGFALLDASGHPALASWRRFGLALTGDTAKRQVYLPIAGSYALFVDDSRGLIDDLDSVSGIGLHDPIGSATTCYFGTIRHVALPPATVIADAGAGQLAGADGGAVGVYAFEAMLEGDLFAAELSTPVANWRPGGVVVRGGEVVALGSFGVGFTAGAVAPSEPVLLVVDSEHIGAVSPRPYTLDVLRIPGRALPIDGTPIGLAVHDGEFLGFADVFESNYLYFDVTSPGQIVQLELSSPGVEVAIARGDVVRASSSGLASLVPSTAIGSLDGKLVRFAKPGRYYLVSRFSFAVPGLTYTLSAKLSVIATTPVTVGTPMPDQPLPTQGSAFYALDIQTAHRWLEFGVTSATNWGAGNNARIRLYDLAAGEGVFDVAFQPIQTIVEPPDGSANRGRIVIGDPRDYLVRVDNTGIPGPAPTFTLDIEERTRLTITDPPFDVPQLHGDPMAAGGRLFVLVEAPAATRLAIAATPDSGDVALDVLDTGEALVSRIDTAGAGNGETLLHTVDSRGFVALAVVNRSAAPTAVQTSITALRPPYDVAAGSLAFVDICPTGTLIADGIDDELRSITLPAELAGFQLFGQTLPGLDVKVSSNGFSSLSSQTSFSASFNRVLPDGSEPHGTLAVYWDDLFHVRMCTKHDPVAHTFTIQWTGDEFGDVSEKAEMQLVLHAHTSEIDFIYGPGHTLAGDELGGATIGIENLDNTDGITLGFDQPIIAPSSSLHWTPN